MQPPCTWRKADVPLRVGCVVWWLACGTRRVGAEEWKRPTGFFRWALFVVGERCSVASCRVGCGLQC